jgi:hypothetical protein
MSEKKKRGTKARESAKRRASHAGFHYHNLYQCCQIKWFMRMILRIETRYTAVPLINGSAFHEGKAVFYKTGSKAKALRKAETEIKQRKEEFEYLDDYLSVLDRVPILLEAWIDKFGYDDLKRFRIIAVEEELLMKVPGTSYVFSLRPDAIVEEKDGQRLRYGMETKTSSFSIKTTELGVHYGDQATAYLWGANAFYDKPLYAVIPDIAYWNKQSTKPSNITLTRGDLVQRSPRRIGQFANGLAQLQSIMSQKVEAYKRGADPYTLFQRNTHYCNAFFKPCEYAEICDNDLTKAKRLPPGFRKGRQLIKPDLFDPIEDTAVGIY